MASVLRRRVQEGTLSADEMSALYAQFIQDGSNFDVVELSPAVLGAAGGVLIDSDPGLFLRSSDAVQLAAALTWFDYLASANIRSSLFLVADNRLLAAARLRGLSVENPEDYKDRGDG
jgi:hypothetical protein